MSTTTQTQTKAALTFVVGAPPVIYECPTCHCRHVGQAGETHTCTSHWSYQRPGYLKAKEHDRSRLDRMRHKPAEMEPVQPEQPDGKHRWVWECSVCHDRTACQNAPGFYADGHTARGLCNHKYTEFWGQAPGVWMPIMRHIERDEALRRWPRVVAHVICESLGCLSPIGAAGVVSGAYTGYWPEGGSEYMDHCHYGDCARALGNAVYGRRYHSGFMAEYRQARLLVAAEIKGNTDPVVLFGSWF